MLCQNATNSAQKYVAVKFHAAKSRDAYITLDSNSDKEDRIEVLLRYINQMELLLDYLSTQVENSLNECDIARESGEALVLQSFEQSVVNKIQAMRVCFEDLVAARKLQLVLVGDSKDAKDDIIDRLDKVSRHECCDANAASVTYHFLLLLVAGSVHHGMPRIEVHGPLQQGRP